RLHLHAGGMVDVVQVDRGREGFGLEPRIEAEVAMARPRRHDPAAAGDEVLAGALGRRARAVDVTLGARQDHLRDARDDQVEGVDLDLSKGSVRGRRPLVEADSTSAVSTLFSVARPRSRVSRSASSRAPPLGGSWPVSEMNIGPVSGVLTNAANARPLKVVCAWAGDVQTSPVISAMRT